MKKGQKRIRFNKLVDRKDQKKFKRAFSKVLDSEWFILGKEVSGFEKEFAKFLGAKYCIGVGNGLDALKIALMSLEIGKGDAVITTPISAVATTLSILAVGAKPIFVDVNQKGLIDPNLIEKSITKKTKAILPVHLYGNPAALDEIKATCKKYNLYLVEDAAQAHGSTYQGKKLGTFGELGCFSFYPTKNLGAFGDGGAIVTSNGKLDKICREIRDYGQGKKYLHSRFGLNSRLDEIQAAILRIKLLKLDKENKKRQLLAKRYIKNLSILKSIEVIKSDLISNSNFHLFVIKVKRRNKLKKFLASKGINTLIHYPLVIPDQPFLRKEYGNQELPEARMFVKSILSLPLYPSLTFNQVDFVCRSIKAFYI